MGEMAKSYCKGPGERENIATTFETIFPKVHLLSWDGWGKGPREASIEMGIDEVAGGREKFLFFPLTPQTGDTLT